MDKIEVKGGRLKVAAHHSIHSALLSFIDLQWPITVDGRSLENMSEQEQTDLPFSCLNCYCQRSYGDRICSVMIDDKLEESHR